MAEFKEEWVDKHQPKTLDDYVLFDSIKKQFMRMVESRSITSMTFGGIQGSGKTTLAKVLCGMLDADVLFVKCATEGVVDTIRTKIEPFCNAMSLDGKLKVVVLDEIDSASSSGTNSFQLALRTLIEDAQSDTRFILTCNTVNKVIPPVLSRCPVVQLGFGKKELLVHVKKILDAENVACSKEALKTFVEDAFKHYPDCRRIIKYLQMCCSSGKLEPGEASIASSEREDFMKELVNDAATSSDMLALRQRYLKAKDTLGDFMDAASALYSCAIDTGAVSSADGILKLTDLLHYVSVCVDKESMFFGMLAAVSKYASKK